MRARRARGFLTASVALAAFLSVTCRSEPGPARRVLLVTIDTLRWDRLGFAGYDVETPNLDRLASSGTTFTQAVTVAPITLPAHSSLLTGLYPPGHGVRANGIFHLDGNIETMTEVLRGAGYATGAFVGAFVLERRFGLTQGFDHYDDELPEENPVHKGYYAERRATEVVERALAWIDARGDEPFFAWVHVFDPHAPYNPPSPFAERYAGRPYAGEIAYTDEALGPLLERVSSMDESLVVVTADHGESLGEHGESTHGIFIYDSTTRVPLIMTGAGIPAGNRIDALVSAVDVAPTVLELAGLELSGEIDGRSLAPHLESGEVPRLTAYAESFLPRFNFNWSELRSLRGDRLKYIHAPRREIFDLTADPGEAENLWGERAPAAAKELVSKLSRIAEEDRNLAAPAELDPDTVRRLESLGYLAASPGSHEARERPDPKDRIEVAERMHALLSPDLSAEEAIAGYRAILEEEPTNAQARNRLANTLSEEGRLEEAVEEYRLLVRGSEIDFTGLENLSAALLLLRRTDEALSTTEMAVKAAPWNPDFLVLRGEAFEQARRLPEALEAYSGAVELEPVPENFWRRGAVREKLSELGEAEADYREALSRDAGFEPALAALARLLARSDRSRQAQALLDEAEPDAELDSVELESARAEVHLASGRYSEAKALLEEARRREPENTRVLALLGPIYGREGDLDRAAATLEKALSLGETSAEVRRNLAVVYVRQGNVPAAVDELQGASEDAPEDPAIWFSLGNALVRLGDFGRAVPAFERALALRSPWPEAAFNLGVAAERAGQRDRAADAYRAFLDAADPNDTARRSEAESRLRRLTSGS